MTTAVILTHQDVRLGVVESPTVQIVLLSKLQPFLWELCRTASSSVPVERIVEFVKENHRYWEEQRGAEQQQEG